MATERVVTRMNILSEYCIPLAKIGGYLVTLKGSKARDELIEAKNAIKVLGGKVEEVKELTLPDIDSKHTLIVIRKIKVAPKEYPRQADTSNKEPL